MQPIEFKEQNKVFTKPESMTDEQCQSLPVWMGKDTQGVPNIISCWEVTPQELLKINETGKIWLSVCGSGMPPVLLMAENPFVYDESKEG